MATIKINEFSKAVPPGPIPSVVPVAVQSVTYTTSTQSSALNAATQFVQFYADADAYIEFGENPTATATSLFVPASVLVEYWVPDTGYDRLLAIYDGSS